MKKHEEKKKKKSTYGPKDVLRRVIWAHFCCWCHPDIFSCLLNIDNAKYIS